MSIVTTSKDASGKIDAQLLRLNVGKDGKPIDEISLYSPTEDEQNMRALILKHFTFGSLTMDTPRVEFNDLSVRLRDQFDQMAWNTYQPNNGEPYQGDQINSWRSNAVRPVVRNKAISIAAHATARLIFPKIFAFSQDSKRQAEAAQVIEDLMEWACEESGYAYTALQRVIASMYAPASIGYTEYGEVYRTVKTEKDSEGKWIEKRVRDEAYPCFYDAVVPVDQLYIENFYENDLQKQGWLIWRKVYSFSIAQEKYGTADNFKFVRPGVQTIYDDANRGFYYVYDNNMRQEDVEEIVYWNKTLDVKITMINGVLISDFDQPNPRNDKMYPFDKFGYELINTKCFYYKSLAFKLMHDSEILNTLYQMVIDGTYLNIFKPMVNVGGEMIASDVIVPGAVTTLSDPNADLRAINLGSDLKSGLEMLQTVENSINESSQEPQLQGADAGGSQTAYEISRLEQNANTVLGLFVQMIAEHVKNFGKLRLGDILQYLTLADASEISDNPDLVYRTFLLPTKQNGTSVKSRKIKFDDSLPDEPIGAEQKLSLSYDVLAEEDSEEGTTISKVNPRLMRDLKYMVCINPDVQNPRSEDLMRAYNVEMYDKLIANPLADQTEALKLLLESNPRTKKNPDNFIAKQQTPMNGMNPMAPGAAPTPGVAANGASLARPQPTPLPQSMSAGTLR